MHQSSKKRFQRISYYFLMVGLGSMILGIALQTEYEKIFTFFFIITLTLSALAIIPFWREKAETQDGQPEPILLVYVSGTLYAVIGGFAIVQAIKFVADAVVPELNKQLQDSVGYVDAFLNITSLGSYEIIMGLVFLLTAIPFYNGAMIFISDKSRNIGNESARWLAFHFVFLFSQSIIFVGIAFALESIVMVILLLVILMIIDTIWIIVGQRSKNKPPKGWLALNLAFTSVLIFSLFQDSLDKSLLVLLLGTIVRTAIDYIGFTDLYSKH